MSESLSRVEQPTARALELLDAICLDSLEGLASEQVPEDGQVSAWFHELRSTILSLAASLREAEQERDEEKWQYAQASKNHAHVVAAHTNEIKRAQAAEARLRVVEEALRQIDEESTHYDVAAGHLGYIARAALGSVGVGDEE